MADALTVPTCIWTRNSVLMRRAASLSPSPRVAHSASICKDRGLVASAIDVARSTAGENPDMLTADVSWQGVRGGMVSLLNCDDGRECASSMKTMEGARSRARLNSCATSFSLSPIHFDTCSSTSMRESTQQTLGTGHCQLCKQDRGSALDD